MTHFTQTEEGDMLDKRGDTIYCDDGIGSVEIDTDALTEAIFRWRRGEKREALHYLETAFSDHHFRGLADLCAEDIRT